MLGRGGGCSRPPPSSSSGSQPFGGVCNLVAIAEEVQKFTAICHGCAGDAPFSKRLTADTDVEVGAHSCPRAFARFHRCIPRSSLSSCLRLCLRLCPPSLSLSLSPPRSTPLALHAPLLPPSLPPHPLPFRRIPSLQLIGGDDMYVPMCRPCFLGLPEARGGSIHITVGPMFSGKSSDLLRRVRRLQHAKKRCLMVKFRADARYSEVCVNSSACCVSSVPSASSVCVRWVDRGTPPCGVLGHAFPPWGATPPPPTHF